MWRGTLTWRLLLGNLAVMILPLIMATWYTSSLYRTTFIRQIEDGEKRNAYLVARNVVALLNNNDTVQINSLCRELSRDLDGMRITVILPSGKVIADSHQDPALMENHAYRPEIMEAKSGGTGISQRYSTTLHNKMKYLAIPARNHGEIVAVVRTAVPAVSIANALNTYYGKIAFAIFIMVVAALLLSVFLGQGITKPIKELERGAQRFSRGELSTKVAVPGIDELTHLSKALNDMASQLDNRIKTITAQRNEQEAILSSMTEGVVAVDASESILSINAAAAVLFSIEGQAVHSRFFGEVVRNSGAQRFVHRLIEKQTPLEEDITLQAFDGERRRDLVLQVHGTLLRDSGNKMTGAVIVASDVTRLRQLETIRKEFVANVSHELRTPLTSIKGFVETLQGGAIDSREDASRFLGIIAAQVDRLSALVDDLLTLARIEREEEDASIVLEERPLMPIVNAALRDFAAAAGAKNISIEAMGDTTVSARVNAAMLEQAVGNLIDNAIKYSDIGKPVTVTVSRERDDAVISVADQGIGIAPEYHERIFERFYRVDKARSRKAGGTGLGLSIVKHIAALHNGSVSVKSVPGSGSTFSITLPLSQKTADDNDRG